MLISVGSSACCLPETGRRIIGFKATDTGRKIIDLSKELEAVVAKKRLNK